MNSFAGSINLAQASTMDQLRVTSSLRGDPIYHLAPPLTTQVMMGIEYSG